MRLLKRLAPVCIVLASFFILFGNVLTHQRAAVHFQRVAAQLAANSVGDHEASEIDEACRIWPANAYYHLTRALVYEREMPSGEDRQAKRFSNLRVASEELRIAIGLNPSDPILYQNLGWVEFLRGNSKASLEAFKRTLALDPLSAQAHFSLFLIQTALGHDPESAVELSSAIRWSPSLADCIILRGLRDQCPITYETAASSAVRTLESASISKDPVEQARLSKLYLLRGEITNAEVLARQSLEALPNLSRPWIVLGDLEGLRGNSEQKRRAYIRAAAVSQNSTDAPAFMYLGDRSKGEGHWQNATAFYQLSLRRMRAPSSDHALYSQAVYKASEVVSNDLIPQQLLAWTAPALDLKSLYTNLSACYRAMGKIRASREYEDLAKQPSRRLQLEGRPLRVCPVSVPQNQTSYKF